MSVRGISGFVAAITLGCSLFLTACSGANDGTKQDATATATAPIPTSVSALPANPYDPCTVISRRTIRSVTSNILNVTPRNAQSTTSYPTNGRACVYTGASASITVVTRILRPVDKISDDHWWDTSHGLTDVYLNSREVGVPESIQISTVVKFHFDPKHPKRVVPTAHAKRYPELIVARVGNNQKTSVRIEHIGNLSRSTQLKLLIEALKSMGFVKK